MVCFVCLTHFIPNVKLRIGFKLWFFKTKNTFNVKTIKPFHYSLKAPAAINLHLSILPVIIAPTLIKLNILINSTIVYFQIHESSWKHRFWEIMITVYLKCNEVINSYYNACVAISVLIIEIEYLHDGVGEVWQKIDTIHFLLSAFAN